MRFDAPPELVDALFDSWDPRGSGMLEIAQPERLLHRGAELQGLEAPVAPQQHGSQPAPPPGPRRALPAFMQSRDAPGQLGSSSSLPALPSAQGLHEGRVPREPPSLILPSAFDTSVWVGVIQTHLMTSTSAHDPYHVYVPSHGSGRWCPHLMMTPKNGNGEVKKSLIHRVEIPTGGIILYSESYTAATYSP